MTLKCEQTLIQAVETLNTEVEEIEKGLLSWVIVIIQLYLKLCRYVSEKPIQPQKQPPRVLIPT